MIRDSGITSPATLQPGRIPASAVPAALLSPLKQIRQVSSAQLIYCQSYVISADSPASRQELSSLPEKSVCPVLLFETEEYKAVPHHKGPLHQHPVGGQQIILLVIRH